MALSALVNRRRYVEGLAAVLKPSGRLLLGCLIMTGEWTKAF